MNGGAYGREVKDILVSARVVLRSGDGRGHGRSKQLGYTYRHSEVPDGAVVVGATFRGTPGDPARIGAEMDRIAAAREETQPIRSRTGGSTFKNPPGHKAWALIDAAGCRGMTMGGAQVSEKHCNFLLNLGSATSADIEALGEEVRRRVLGKNQHHPRMGNPADRQGMNKNFHVVVLMGGWSSEREVSLTSGRGVAEALRERGWSNVTEIDMDRNVARCSPSCGPTSCSTRCTARRARTAPSRACST